MRKVQNMHTSVRHWSL